MGNIDFSKITKIISVIAIAVAGFYLLMMEIAKKDKIFSQLSSDQTFYVIIGIGGLGFLVVLILIILILIKPDKKENQPKSTRKPKKKKRKVIIPILVLILIISFGIIGYSAIKRMRLITDSFIFTENFSKNSYPEVWREGDQNEAFVRISNNSLNILCKGKYSVSRRIDINKYFQFSLIENSNYSIELRIKHTNGNTTISNGGYGLQWGGNSKNSFYYGFYLNESGEFSIKVYNYTNPIANISDWQKSDFINSSSFNVLKLTRTGNSYKFYINDKEVASFMDLDPLGNEIGFGVPPKIDAKIDYLKIKDVK